MKKLFVLAAVLFCGMLLQAQETFFPIQEGKVLIYKSFDKKEKLTGTAKYTIRHVNISGNNMDITYEFESIDPKDKPVYQEEITIHQKGDKLYLDMSKFINKAAFQQEGEISADIQITGNNMEIPSNPKPGDLLPDAQVEMAMKLGFVNMKMSAQVTNRKVEAIESITVNAGTFETYKFTSEVNSSSMGVKLKSNNIDWYAKGIGIIKSESLDKNGNLQSYTELTEIK